MKKIFSILCSILGLAIAANAQTKVSLEDADRSPAADLRLQLTGLVPGLEILESSGAIMSNNNMGTPNLNSNVVTLNAHGLSGVVLILDGVLVPFNQLQLDLNQVESIELLTDAVSKAKFGPRASYGALCIKTKRGEWSSPMKITAEVRSGVDFVDRWPEWVDGYEYAMLNNMARMNDGYLERFDDEALFAFTEGDMFHRKYPSVNYRDLIYKDWKPTSMYNMNVSGGSATVKYNLSLDGLTAGDIYAVGPATDFNKINVSSAVSARIGKWIEASASFNGMIGIRRGNQSSFADYRKTPATSFPVALGISSNDSELDGVSAGNVIYAVSRAFPNNPYAAVVDGGFYTNRYRTAMFNATIDVNMGFLLPGLKSRTFIGENNCYNQKVGKSNDYIAYYWDPESDIGEISSHVGTKAASKSSQGTFTYQSLNFYERLSYEMEKNGHRLDAGAMFYLTNQNHSNNSYYERQAYFVADADYSFRDRYFVEAAVEYAGSSRLSRSHRYDIFPTAAFTWMASEEDFLKSASWLDLFKIRLSGGSIADADIFSDMYLYSGLYTNESGDIFGPATAYQWFGSDKRTSSPTTISRLSNPGLRWPRINQVDLLAQMSVLGSLDFSVNAFLIDRWGMLTDVSSEYASALGLSGTTVYDNYNENLVYGADLAARYHGKSGDWRWSVGLNASVWETVRTKYANDFYLYDYQKIEGTASDVYRGFVCLGKFESEAEIASSPLFDPDTRIGDLKYKDVNEDGVIDANDKVILGHTSPRLRYGLNLDLHWKDLSLFVVGTGRAFYKTAMTGEYFWNGWGDDNYSRFVLDNLGGAYPRIGFDKAVNNFQTSDFWLADGGYFKLQSVELAYDLKLPSVKFIDSMRFSLRGGNLFTLTKMKYVDPEAVSSGVTEYPLFRSIQAGVRINF